MKLWIHTAANWWTPAPDQIEALARSFPGDGFVARLYPRSMVETVLGRKPARQYAFRAFTRNGESHLFVDETETPDSIAWLLGHELCHQEIAKQPRVKRMLDKGRPQDLDPAGDRFHEEDPEERRCDDRATRIVGYRTDRKWWRKRVLERTEHEPEGESYGEGHEGKDHGDSGDFEGYGADRIC